MGTIVVKDANGQNQTAALVAATGQAAKADSLPVVIASDQTAVPVADAALASALTAIQTLLGTLATLNGQSTANTALANINSGVQALASAQPLPTGAATSALQSAANTALSALNASVQALSSSQPLPTGAATAALQTEISGKLPATLGPKASAASMSVVLASDEVVPGYDQTYSTHTPQYAQVTVTNTAQTLAALLGAAVPTWATMAFILPAGVLRYRADGTSPTTSVGMPIAAGQAWPVQGAAALAALKLIAASSTTVDIEFRG